MRLCRGKCSELKRRRAEAEICHAPHPGKTMECGTLDDTFTPPVRSITLLQAAELSPTTAKVHSTAGHASSGAQ